MTGLRVWKNENGLGIAKLARVQVCKHLSLFAKVSGKPVCKRLSGSASKSSWSVSKSACIQVSLCLSESVSKSACI